VPSPVAEPWPGGRARSAAAAIAAGWCTSWADLVLSRPGADAAVLVPGPEPVHRSPARARARAPGRARFLDPGPPRTVPDRTAAGADTFVLHDHPPCARDCPKAARASGRRHTCVKAGDPGVCAADCAEHASTCPQRTGGGLVFRETKERRRKTVPLPPELAAMLRSHWIAQKAERLAAANLWQDYGVVFSESDGGPLDPRDDWQEWADILQEAGVPHHGVHAARHSAASIMIDEGIALTVVQEMLGHSDIRVTRQYVHTSSPVARNAAARMGRAILATTVPTTVPNGASR